MTLFPRNFVDTLPASIAVKPEFEAVLKIFVAINGPIDRLEFEYDKNLLTVSPEILSDKGKTNSLVVSSDKVKITCKSDLLSDKEIKIYCYPTNGQQRSLAGKIIVIKNNMFVRKNIDFILVGVKTDADKDGRTEDGSFGQQETRNLYNSLYQALIIPNIVDTTLDLSTNADFQVGGQYVETDSSGVNYIAYLNKTNHNFTNNLHAETRRVFFDVQNGHGSINGVFSDIFTIFKFGLESNNRSSQGTLGGAAEDIKKRNALIFTLPWISDDTTKHEALHGLGLQHTHSNSAPRPIPEPERKYVFPNGNDFPLKSTDNIMSYGNKVKKSTWRWQWNIINLNISEK